MGELIEKNGDVEGGRAVQESTPAGLKLRIPYSKAFGEYSGIDQRQWQVLIDSIWPGAQTFEGVTMALSYCIARRLDPMKRPVHIVPMWSSSLRKTVETVWPGIAEIRTTATRTGVYAGKDAAEFGEDETRTFTHDHDGKHTEKEVTFPTWCRVTVYRMVDGQRCAFVGPKVFWEESYATMDRFSTVPNEMWADRKSGQLEKCAEAASLRAAFPEELGNEYTAEEMWGRTINHAPPPVVVDETVAIPPRPKLSEFERDASKDKPARKSRSKKADEAKSSTAGEKPSEPTQSSSAAGQTGDGKVEGEAKEPAASSTAKPSSGAQRQFANASEPLARGLDILTRTKKTNDVADLRGTIKEELTVMGEVEAWDKACDARSKEILGGGK